MLFTLAPLIFALVMELRPLALLFINRQDLWKTALRVLDNEAGLSVSATSSSTFVSLKFFHVRCYISITVVERH